MAAAKAAGVALGLLLAACTTTTHVELSAEQRQSVKAARVASLVAVADRPAVFAKDAAAGGFVFGMYGMLAAASLSDEPQRLKHFLEANGIDVGKIVREEFVRQSARAQGFPRIVEEGGDAVVHLAIESYGLAHTLSLRPIDKPLSPTLAVTARMSSADGRVLWQKGEVITAQNLDTDAHQFDVYVTDREITEKGFRKAAEIVVAGLLQEFQAAPAPAVDAGAPRERRITPLAGPDAKRFERGHDSGGNIRFESEPGGDGRCSTYVACGARDPRQVNR